MKPSKMTRAFTLVELLISVGIVCLIAMILIQPTADHRRPRTQQIKCVNNLKNLGLAVRIFALNNNDRAFPSVVTNLPATTTAVTLFQILSNELATPQLLTCPADARVRVATNWPGLGSSNISFFVNRGINEHTTFLFGDRNLMTNGVAVPSGAMLSVDPGIRLSWTTELHRDHGNIALSDGSVQSFSSKRLMAEVPRTEMTLLFP